MKKLSSYIYKVFILGYKTLFVALTASILISACNENQNTSPSGQVIATVNDEEISIHQLNFLLQRSPEVNLNNSEQAKQQFLNALVEQTIMVQQAKLQEMDRKPEVILAIEHAKRQVLAQTWLEHSIKSTATKPTKIEIENYYTAHPELFEQRKIYHLKELLIKQKPDQALTQQLNNNKKIDNLISYLDKNKLAYQLNITTLPAENLPLQSLTALQALKSGQFIVINKENEVLVLGMLSASIEPVTKDRAVSIIENFLQNQQRQQSAKQITKQLKTNANIELLMPSPTKIQKNEQDKALAEQNNTKPVNNNIEKDAIEQGAKGL